MTELNNERVIVKQALEEREVNAILFEDFGAKPQSSQKAYLTALEQCDIYLGLFWNRYSKATNTEFRKARELSKPLFIYVKNFEVHRDRGLTRLLNFVQKRWVYKTFSDVVELKHYVQQDIQDWLISEWRKARSELVALQQKLVAEANRPSTGGAGGLNILSESYGLLESFQKRQEALHIRITQVERSLPKDIIPFAEREETNLLLLYMEKLGFRVFARFALASGNDLFAFVSPGKSEHRDEQEAVLFTSHSVELTDYEELTPFGFMGFVNIYVVPVISEFEQLASAPSNRNHVLIYSIKQFKAHLEKIGLK